MKLLDSLLPNGSPQVLEGPLSHWIEVRRRFARSVHLERDLSALASPQVLEGANDALEGYAWTASAQEALERVAYGLDSARERAITLIGPYGSGKSALGVLLCALVQGQPRAVEIVRAHAPDLADALSAPNYRLLTVPLVGARAPLAPAFVQAIFAALERADESSAESGIAWKQSPREVAAILRQEFADLMPCLDAGEALSGVEARRVADLLARASDEVKRAGGAGVMLVADEAGKWLEYAALYPQRTDILLLQEVAEACARSGSGEEGGALWTILVLHQGAQDYARGLGRTAQAEWRKVSERFREVPFQPPDAERVEVVARALEHRAPLLQMLQAQPLLAELYRECGRLMPQSLHATWSEWAQHSYPLHPLSLACLPLLFRRSGQSHRSAFNFLAAREPGALGDFLASHSFDPSQPDFPLLGLDALFDYASQVLAPSWSAGSARSWALAQESVQSASDLDAPTRRTLKIIALLHVLHDASLPASPQVLALALRDARTNADQAAELATRTLQVLEGKSLLMRSRLRGTYRLWDGGDVDVETELEDARSALTGSLSLDLAREVCAPPRLVARRHALETGTTRHFEPRTCDVGQLEKFVSEESDALALVFCLAQDRDELNRALEAASRSRGTNALIGVALESSALREASHESAACREVSQKSDALRGDSAARREIARRDSEARTAFAREWNAVFGNVLPGAAFEEGEDEEGAAWWCAGHKIPLRGSRDLSQWLSHMAEATFPKAPRVRNELVNRHSLSSSAAAGRRNLIEAMWKRGDKTRLGIVAFPPEAAIYESLLHAPKIHRTNASGDWEWGAPTGTDTSGVRPLWEEMEAIIFDPARQDDPLAIPELWKRLGAPPFGAAQGILPPLLCAFVLANRSDIAIFREGTFLFDMGIEDWEVMLRAPHHFSIAGVKIDRARESVRAIADLLGCEPLPLPTVSALLRRTEPFNQWSRKTRTLNGSVKPLREVLLNAKAPHVLLLHDLPRALKVSIDEPQVLADALRAALDEWSVAYTNLLRQLRDEWLVACGLKPGARGWMKWCDEALAWRPRLRQGELAPLLTRAALWLEDDEESDAPRPDDERAPEGVALFESLCNVLSGRAPKNWSDADVERVRGLIAEHGVIWQEERARQSRTQSGGGDDASTWSGEISRRAEHARKDLLLVQRNKADTEVSELKRRWLDRNYSPPMRRAILLRMLLDLGEDPEQ